MDSQDVDCLHGIQFNGLCVQCGKTIEEEDTVIVSYNRMAIKATPKGAERLTRDNMTTMLESRKLLLLVDLDQTVLHASNNPAIGEWMKDEKNTHYLAAMNIHKFTLPPNPIFYYIKPRPGLMDFLSEISKLYEMHIYTNGTRDYAYAVAKALDPKGELFQDRIMSRDDSDGLTQKKFQRRFLCDPSMIAIIDDREDVWEDHKNPSESQLNMNLLKIKPYEFFTGAGDINDPSLIKRNAQLQEQNPQLQERIPQLPEPSSEPVQTVQTSDDSPIIPSTGKNEQTELPEHVEQVDGEQETHPEESAESQDKAAQEKNKQQPLIQDQTEWSQQVKPSLIDNDRELMKLLGRLKELHARFYAAYDEIPKVGAGSPKDKVPEHPNMQKLIASAKKNVLRGVSIVFSGVIRLGAVAEECTIWRKAEEYGATCGLELTGKTTHLVAVKRGTSKVNAAMKYANVHIVHLAWLEDSINGWTRQDEKAYPLSVFTPPADTEGESTPFDIEDEVFDADDLKLESFDWDEADKEVDDCLDESGTDLGDTDSEAFGSQQRETIKLNKRKRSRQDSDEDKSELNSDDESNSSPTHLPRQKSAKHGPSHLSHVTTADVADPSSSSSRSSASSEDELESQLDGIERSNDDNDEEEDERDYDEDEEDEEDEEDNSSSIGDFADFLDEEVE